MHEAKARNWDGKELTVTFRLNANDFERLCKRAHKEFHDDGKYTIRLLTVDGIEVPVEMQYSN